MYKEDKIMQLLEERIIKDGKVFSGNVLKVDSFLNHQIDVNLMDEIGKETKRLFNDEDITKVLTIEASGIGIGCMIARHFNCPLLFAKKTKTLNIKGDVYTSQVESFTHQCTYDIILSKDFLNSSYLDVIMSNTVISCAFTLPEEITDFMIAVAIFPAPIDVIRKKDTPLWETTTRLCLNIAGV